MDMYMYVCVCVCVYIYICIVPGSCAVLATICPATPLYNCFTTALLLLYYCFSACAYLEAVLPCHHLPRNTAAAAAATPS
jgi:hypothetical protein